MIAKSKLKETEEYPTGNLCFIKSSQVAKPVQTVQPWTLPSSTRSLMGGGFRREGLQRTVLSPKYKLQEMSTDSYKDRTEQNVIDSDGTVIISHGKLTGGSAYTQKIAKYYDRPFLHIDLRKHDVLPAAIEMLTWIDERNIKVLNVAGPRASKDPNIYTVVKEVLESLLIIEASRKHILGSLRFNKTPTGRDIKMPDTVNEAVDRLMSEMSLRDKTILLKMAEDDLVSLHFTVGMWIRNNFVYPRNDKLLESCREVSRDQVPALCTDAHGHNP